MGFINDYVPEEYNTVFDVEDGLHRMIVNNVRVTQTKDKSKNMLEIDFLVQASNGKACPVVYTERYPEGDYFNRNITRFFDAFKLQRGDFNFVNWKGAKGQGMFKHKTETYLDSYGCQKTSNRCVLSYFDIEGVRSASQSMQPTPKAAQAQNAAPATPETFPEDIPYDGDIF